MEMMYLVEKFNGDLTKIPDNPIIVESFLTCENKLKAFKKVMVSLSGGSDSDVMLDLVERCKPNDCEIHYVFFDIGLEFSATHRHLKYLEERYGIEIERVRPEYTIPAAVRKVGQPWKNKQVSDMIHRLQIHNFDFKDRSFDEDMANYNGMKTALSWWYSVKGEKSQFNMNKDRFLHEFMVENPPDFNISMDCCTLSKKKVAKKYHKENGIELQLVGVRKNEGGLRKTSIKSCFSPKNDKAIAQYRPLFWYDTDAKKTYEKFFEIKNSDCYTVYGMPRTGCAGCPFARDYQKELEIIQKFEPKLYKACQKVFGPSYEYYDKFLRFREEKKKENII